MTATRRKTKRATKPGKVTAGTRVVIYLRISKDRANQTSIASQERVCRAYAESQGWTVVGVETDQGKSAWNGAERVGFNRAVGMIENGLADVLLVWALDRAVRNVKALADLLDTLDAAGAGFSSATQPVDTTTNMGRAMIQIIGVLAELESAMKSERMSEAHQERRDRGEIPVGPRSLGYQRDHEGGMYIVEEEATTVRRIYDEFLDGRSMNAIKDGLNESGCKTSTGRKFWPQTVRDILSNPRYVGLMEVDDVLLPAKWDAIVERETWDRVQTIRETEIKPRSTYDRSLLTGLLKCGRCGSNMRGGLPSRGGRRYTCSGDGCFNGVAEAMADEFIVRTTIGVISPDRWNDIREQANGIDPTVAIRAEIEQLGRDRWELDMSREEWLAARGPLIERLAAAEEQGIVRSDLPAVDDIAGAWDDLTFAQQRTVMFAFLDHVDVGPSKNRGRFDPERFTPHDRA